MKHDPHLENRVVEFVKDHPDISLGSAVQACLVPDSNVYTCPKGLQTVFKGKKIRTIGSTIFPRSLHETLQEFQVHHLINFMGETWFKYNRTLPPENRHVIVKWLDDYEAHRKSIVPANYKPGEIFSGQPIGSVQALMALADDIYRLKLINVDLKKHRKRLQSMNTFQGVRYELAVAGCWARCGFKIEWWDRPEVKGPEFIAVNEAAKERIAVEAKSRHRPGVLNQPGEMPDFDSIKGDLSKLFNEALQQRVPGERFAVFLDLNIPIDHDKDGFEKRLWEHVKALVDKFPIDTVESPAPYCLLVFTNWSWHYHPKSPAGSGENMVSLPNYSDLPFNNAETFNAIRNTVGKHGCVPFDE